MASRILAVGLLVLGLLLPPFASGESGQSRHEGPVVLAYPPTRRVDQVDDYHGTKVADPYRWLEADIRNSPEVADWVAAENKVTFRFLDAIPQREKIRRRLTELWNFTKYSSPQKEGGRYFYFKNDGLQNQPVLYVADSLDGEARVLLDPNRGPRTARSPWTAWGSATTASYLAYARAEAGSDWSTWHVMEIDSRQAAARRAEMDQVLHGLLDQGRQGLLLQPLRGAPAGRQVPVLNFNNKLYYHRLGTPQAADVLVYYRPEHPDWHYDGEVTEDGRYLVIVDHRGHRRPQPRSRSAT